MPSLFKTNSPPRPVETCTSCFGACSGARCRVGISRRCLECPSFRRYYRSGCRSALGTLTKRSETVRACWLDYVAALAAIAAFFPLMISERISVSSSRPLIDRGHSGGLASFVGDRAHAVDDVGVVCHQLQQ